MFGKAKKEKKIKKHGKIYHVVKTVLSTLWVLLLIFAITIINNPTGPLVSNTHMLNSLFKGVHNNVKNPKGMAENISYYPDVTEKNAKKAENELDESVSNEGVVLLKNEGNSLPLKKGSKISLLGINSTAGGSQSYGPMTIGYGISLNKTLENAGFKVNNDLWNFYTSKDIKKNYGLTAGSISYGDAEDFSINEVPLPVLEKNGMTRKLKGTTPVYVLSRVAGEGRDMARGMASYANKDTDKEKSYLDPDSTELEILKYLNDNFDNTVLVVNSNAALDMGFLKDFPNIKSIIYTPKTTTSLGRILSGEVSPSGRTVDTFAADALKSPAAQNFGDYQYSKDGKMTKYNYLSYKEGIYVGYRYYETRYEDAVLGQGNAGDYDYSKEVIYPFGYGLSYTDFKWSDYSLAWNGDTATARIKVTNTGDVAGKDVVEIYAQSPYTDYDKANGVEKSSVQLMAYEKTETLQPGDSETVTATFNKDQLKAFDRKGTGSYVFDAGTYYITAAKDAHDAANQIILKKNPEAVTLEAAGSGNAGVDPAFVAEYIPENTETDTTTYAKDNATGTEVTAKLSNAENGIDYLTRSNWTGTFPKHDGQVSDQISTWGNETNGTDKNGKPASYTYTKEITDKTLKALESKDAGQPKNDPAADQKIKYGAKNGLRLSDMRGLDYDDPKWDIFIDQLTEQEVKDLVMNSGYGISAVKSVGKGFNIDADTAYGLMYGGDGVFYPNPMTLAQTWNHDLAEKYGECIGMSATIGGAHGCYAPSMDTHRTPFSGRNGEYYSEDPLIAGTCGMNEVKGAAKYGMYTYIKHFAFNDQEDHRGDRVGQFSVATYMSEQAAREIYLKPFEMCIKAGNMDMKYLKKTDKGFKEATAKVPYCTGVMTAFNRIGNTWAGGSYPLITGILKNEWGFKGMIITDNANTGVFMLNDQMLRAGGDMKLTNFAGAGKNSWDETTQKYARNAVHNIMYTTANSKAMEGVAPGGVVKTWLLTDILRIVLTVLFILIIAVLIIKNTKRLKNFKRELNEK